MELDCGSTQHDPKGSHPKAQGETLGLRAITPPNRSSAASGPNRVMTRVKEETKALPLHSTLYSLPFHRRSVSSTYFAERPGHEVLSSTSPARSLSSTR